MRNFSFFLAFAVLMVAGCNYDPVAVCVDRCEQRKSLGCESSGTDCDNSCVLADDVYDSGLDTARESGCVSEYNAFVSCSDSTPACASLTVIAEMCAEEYLVWQNCM